MKILHRDTIAICGVILLAAGVFVVRVDRDVPISEARVAGRPVEVPQSGYISSTTCRACHPHEYATWHDSYHRTMTQIADPDSVIGDFDDVTLERFGRSWHLQRRGDAFWIDMPDPMAAPGEDTSRIERKVSMMTGSHHMQLYWYESGHTRVTGLLPFAYLTDEEQWIPRFAAFVMPPSEDVSPEFGQWNYVCIKCHATHGRPRVEMDAGGLYAADTHVSEFGIACETCHGPAHAHVAANRDPLRRYSLHVTDGADTTVVNPARLQHRLSAQVCGQCHGNFDDVRSGRRLREWFAHGYAYRPGDDLEETRPVNRIAWDMQFWPDGVVRTAGREYNGLVGSGCFDHGEMSCLSCHEMHQAANDPRPRSEWANDQLGYGMDGDLACLQCHEAFADDIAAHTHHAPGSQGSACYNCHMPFTSYGLLKGVRNHRIDSPDIATTIATGRPNACNQCHLDKPLAWSAEYLELWYGIEQPNLPAEHTLFAASVIWTLKGDAAQRALAASRFGWDAAHQASGTEWMAPYLAELLDDPYEAVRIIAQRALRTLPGYEDARYDLVAEPQQRAEARAAVMERWRAAMVATRIDRDLRAVLIEPDGTLREDLIARMLLLRDRRPVTLLE